MKCVPKVFAGYSTRVSTVNSISLAIASIGFISVASVVIHIQWNLPMWSPQYGHLCNMVTLVKSNLIQNDLYCLAINLVTI